MLACNRVVVSGGQKQVGVNDKELQLRVKLRDSRWPVRMQTEKAGNLHSESRYQASPSEARKDLVCVVVKCKHCELVKQL